MQKTKLTEIGFELHTPTVYKKCTLPFGQSQFPIIMYKVLYLAYYDNFKSS